MDQPVLPTSGTAEVAENIYAIYIPLPGNPLKCLNSYVIKGERNLLVDTGFRQKECREALLGGLRELGISMEDTDIFLTHLHADHCGLAPELASESSRVWIGEHDLGCLPGPGNRFSWAESDRRYASEGFPEELLTRLVQENPAQSLSPLPFDRYLPVTDGMEFPVGSYTFRAIHTPGHTPGHMMLWEERTGIALLGDHVLFDITPNISRWMDRADSLGDYLNSLRRVNKLDVRLPLPAHRQVHMDFHQRCEELIAHHSRRCAEVLNILGDGAPRNAWTIAARMTWKIRARSWEEFPNAQKWFAVGEALAHLDHLIALNQVERIQQENGQYLYRIR